MVDALYDQIADIYDETRGREAEPLAALVVQCLGLPTAVLDVGVGSGLTTATIEAAGHRVFGVDVSGRMLALARRRDPGARLVRADATRLPIPDDSFDRVMSVQVFQLLAEPEWLLSEIARVLRPGGVLVIAPVVVEVPDDPINRTYWDGRPLREAPGALAHLVGPLLSTGFRDVTTSCGPRRSHTVSPMQEADRLDELWGGSPFSDRFRALPNADEPIEVDATLSALVAMRK